MEKRNIGFFGKMGWFFGVNQILGAIFSLGTIFFADYMRDHFGLDIFFGQKQRMIFIIIIVAFLTLLSGLVIIPPILEKIRAKFPIMNSMYAAPALSFVLAISGMVAMRYPMPKEAVQEANQSYKDQLQDIAAQKGYKIDDQGNVTKTSSQDSELKELEAQQPEPVKLRGTVYLGR